MRRIGWVTGALLAAAIAAEGCGSEVETSSGGTGATSGGTTTSTSSGTGGGGGALPTTPADKIDLLFMIDNSRSMADKQEVLAATVPDLVRRLANPLCLDAQGNPLPTQPPSPLDDCPPDGTREFPPIVDIHIGVISSSIGGHGSDACPIAQSPSNDDKAHLLSRLDPAGGAQAPTYESKGFLAWDPAQKLAPPGEADAAALVQNLRDMVIGVGQVGCGYESQLESWYRFLADPEPYLSISVVDGKATPQGVDDVLLAQRKDFLRSDSLLAVVMLTDENDCSTKESGQFYYANQLQNPGGAGAFHLPRARSECAQNPSDPCCKSCGQDPGSCPADPTCSMAPLSDLEDNISVRCFEQKRRFGIDFMYPIERYVDALTNPTIANRAGELVPNPIFSDLDPNDGVSAIRDPGLVFLAGVVGVPWQDIARDPADLAKGLKNHDERNAPAVNGWTTWDIVLGDFASYADAKDPLMIESIDPRSGANPVTGAALAPPGSLTNPINGGEYSIPLRNDLQFACVFPLAVPRDCSAPGTQICECYEAQNDSPLCAPNPSDGNAPTLQVRAKAYPGRRELAVLEGMGPRGVVGSICPAQLLDETQPDFGYRPSVAALIEAMKGRL